MARQKKPFEAVQFTRESAERIAARVRVSELTPTPASPLTFEAVHESRGKAIKLGTFTGPWPVGTYKTVTIYGSTATASVYNWCNPAEGDAANLLATKPVLFAATNGTHSVLELPLRDTSQTCSTSIAGFDLSTLPGYSAGAVQLLGHSASGGTACSRLTWYSVTTCSTAAA